MDEKEKKMFKKIELLCHSVGINFASFLEEVNNELINRVKSLLTPNREWFREGKSLNRYWKLVEDITGLSWEYENVNYWYKLLRDPSETREDIPASLRYQVLTRDKSTCLRCGRKAPQIELVVDHILSWSWGGPTVIDNLQTFCMDCNIGKSNKYVEGEN